MKNGDWKLESLNHAATLTRCLPDPDIVVSECDRGAGGDLQPAKITLRH